MNSLKKKDTGGSRQKKWGDWIEVWKTTGKHVSDLWNVRAENVEANGAFTGM
jgi:hypothetical protein